MKNFSLMSALLASTNKMCRSAWDWETHDRSRKKISPVDSAIITLSFARLLLGSMCRLRALGKSKFFLSNEGYDIILDIWTWNETPALAITEKFAVEVPTDKSWARLNFCWHTRSNCYVDRAITDMAWKLHLTYQLMLLFPVTFFRYENMGRVSGPFTSILLRIIPSYCWPVANADIDDASPGSWRPNYVVVRWHDNFYEENIPFLVRQKNRSNSPDCREQAPYTLRHRGTYSVCGTSRNFLQCNRIGRRHSRRKQLSP